MDKKLIRLTEGDLHNIVKESVNRILTELDWKTYASAAKKASERKDKRAGNFHDAAEKELSKKYGYNSGNAVEDGKSAIVRPMGGFQYPGLFYADANEIQTNDNDSGRKFDKEYHRYIRQDLDNPNERDLYDYNARKRYHELGDELAAFNYGNGKYNYKNGKWNIDNGLTNRIKNNGQPNHYKNWK